MFDIGDEVICVDDTDHFEDLAFPITLFNPRIVKGQKYTIRDTIIWFGYPGVRLNEVVGPTWISGNEAWLKGVRFRKVFKKTTDISVFEKLKTPAPELEEV